MRAAEALLPTRRSRFPVRPRRTFPEFPRAATECSPVIPKCGSMACNVRVAGDATWYSDQAGWPGGSAGGGRSQIARAAGVDMAQEAFSPIIRAALLTGDEPRFLRADLAADGTGAISTSPLWWPAGRGGGPSPCALRAREAVGDHADLLGQVADIPRTDRTSQAEHSASLHLSSISRTAGDARGISSKPCAGSRWPSAVTMTAAPLLAYVGRRERWREKVNEESVSSR